MDSKSHAPSCKNAGQGSSSYVTVKVFRHNPPKVAGCQMLDRDCAGCMKQKSPSLNYNVVDLCERSIVMGALTNSNEAITIDRVAYQLEMCSDSFFVKCKHCKEVFSRSELIGHEMKMHS